MDNKEQYQLLQQGVWPFRNDVVAENLLASSNSPCRFAHPLLIRSRSRSTEGRQPPSLDEDCAYLTRLSRPFLEEEMGELTRCTRCALATLDLGASYHWEDFLSD